MIAQSLLKFTVCNVAHSTKSVAIEANPFTISPYTVYPLRVRRFCKKGFFFCSQLDERPHAQYSTRLPVFSAHTTHCPLALIRVDEHVEYWLPLLIHITSSRSVSSLFSCKFIDTVCSTCRSTGQRNQLDLL